jgi:AcrR family transcriptional regulator
MKSTPRKSRKYHHGNLRSSLLRAAREILRDEGVPGLSLRLVARTAKVSHNAPYHHFPDKSSLLAALAEEGFHELAERITHEQAKRGKDGAWGKLMGVGAGYLSFALENTSLFQMMFQTEITQPDRHPPLQAAEGRAFGTLLAAIVDLQEAGLLPKNRSHLAAAACAWSTVHWLATLRLTNVLDETPLKDMPFEQLAEETLRLITLGILAPDPPKR